MPCPLRAALPCCNVQYYCCSSSTLSLAVTTVRELPLPHLPICDDVKAIGCIPGREYDLSHPVLFFDTVAEQNKTQTHTHAYAHTSGTQKSWKLSGCRSKEQNYHKNTTTVLLQHYLLRRNESVRKLDVRNERLSENKARLTTVTAYQGTKCRVLLYCDDTHPHTHTAIIAKVH